MPIATFCFRDTNSGVPTYTSRVIHRDGWDTFIRFCGRCREYGSFFPNLLHA